jgi:hypothetical protein
VLPTLVDLLDIGSGNMDLDGRSQVPALNGGERERVQDRMIVSLNRLHDYAGIKGDWKVMTDRYGNKELYNLAKDPLEKQNIAADNPDTIDPLVEELFEILDHRRKPEWSLSFSGAEDSPCRFHGRITAEGAVTYVDSLYYPGVNPFDSISLSLDGKSLSFSCVADIVDRNLMFELTPDGGRVTFEIEADPPECAHVFLGRKDMGMAFVTEGAATIEPRRYVPGRDMGAFIFRLPAWKPASWTVLGLTGGYSGSGQTLVDEDTEKQLRELGYIR